MTSVIPDISTAFEPTRATLHQYARVIAAVPRAAAVPHERWWHASLNVADFGLETDPVRLGDGSALRLGLDVVDHKVVVMAGGVVHGEFSMTDGLTGTEMAAGVHAVVESLGVGEEFDRDRYESDEPRQYDPGAAEAFWDVLLATYDVLNDHRSRLGESSGPVQLWPHGFDIAFEWFGTKDVPHEENGETHLLRSQCNFGFYPAGDAYFYANPWPFAQEELLRVDLPHGAQWHTDDWEGSKLPLSQIAGRLDGHERLMDYFMAVFRAAEPTL